MGIINECKRKQRIRTQVFVLGYKIFCWWTGTLFLCEHVMQQKIKIRFK